MSKSRTCLSREMSLVGRPMEEPRHTGLSGSPVRSGTWCRFRGPAARGSRACEEQVKMVAASRIVTDRLRSYGAVFRDLGLTAQHENSHQPVRRRERRMQGFKSPGSTQRFLAIHTAAYNLFNTQRHLISRKTNRQFRDDEMSEWRRVASIA